MKKSLFFLSILLALWSCSDQLENERSILPAVDEDPAEIIESTFVSESMAADVAGLFFKNESTSETRSGNTVPVTEKTIQFSGTVYDQESGKPLMYIINYNEGGFIVVSATKTYYPVLAFNDSGSLTAESLRNSFNGGLTLWAEETEYAIAESELLDEEIALQVRAEWLPYETSDLILEVVTRAADYESFRNRLVQLQTLAPGYSFTTLSGARNFVSEGVYQSMVQTANSSGASAEFSIFAYKALMSEIAPLINTQWHQESPYNALCPNQYPAGCVPIAMGQIMKFHKIPTSYNWNNMQTGTVDTQNLIYNLGIATGVNYGPTGSGTTITKAASTFSSWGYKTTQKDHISVDVRDEVSGNRRPVYMQGVTSAGEGHAWVCAGIRVNSGYSYFVEYAMGSNYTSMGGPSYLSPSSISGKGSEPNYYYFNWGGKNGVGNGWYIEGDLKCIDKTYSNNRQNLYVSPK